jgi:hypothetical protein
VSLLSLELFCYCLAGIVQTAPHDSTITAVTAVTSAGAGPWPLADFLPEQDRGHCWHYMLTSQVSAAGETGMDIDADPAQQYTNLPEYQLPRHSMPSLIHRSRVTAALAPSHSAGLQGPQDGWSRVCGWAGVWDGWSRTQQAPSHSQQGLQGLGWVEQDPQQVSSGAGPTQTVHVACAGRRGAQADRHGERAAVGCAAVALLGSVTVIQAEVEQVRAWISIHAPFPHFPLASMLLESSSAAMPREFVLLAAVRFVILLSSSWVQRSVRPCIRHASGKSRVHDSVDVLIW